MTESRFLIVNADDFGLSPGVNRGIIQSMERGTVTSASLMVRWPAALEAADYGREHPIFSIGLHVDLGEWIFREGHWTALYEVVDQNNRTAVWDEVHRQLDAFQRLLGRNPTHIDSHQHVHFRGETHSVLGRVAEDLRIPLRHFCPGVQYCGDFYGQDGRGHFFHKAIDTAALLAILDRIPPGVTELACHPGFANDIDSMYRDERSMEILALCSPEVRRAIEEKKIQLCSFHHLAGRV